MARARLVKPAFFRHYDLYAAERDSGLPLRLAFEGLWTVADREGRFEWREEIKLDVLPYDPVRFLDVLDALERAGFVRSYVVAGRRYGVIPTIGQHQHFHVREPHSTLPAPPDPASPAPDDGPAPCQAVPRTSPSTAMGSAEAVSRPAEAEAEAEAERTTPTSAARAADQSDGSEAEAAPDTPTPPAPFAADFAEAWAAYPRRPNDRRTRAYRAYVARRRAKVPHAELLAGVQRYAAYVVAAGLAGGPYVLMGATFFGPDEHWRVAWEPPPRAAPTPGAGLTAHDRAVEDTISQLKAMRAQLAVS